MPSSNNQRAEAAEAQLAALTTAMAQSSQHTEAREAELAEALNTAPDCPPTDKEYMMWFTGPRHAALSATPAKALERARAVEDLIGIAREIVSTESAWTSEWVAKDQLLKDTLARLDQSTVAPAKADAGGEEEN